LGTKTEHGSGGATLMGGQKLASRGSKKKKKKKKNETQGQGRGGMGGHPQE